MTSNKSMHTALNPKLVWKYRSIRNPYITPSIIVTSTLDTDENPIIDVPDSLPITTPYNDEIYLSNRILAFERDGWKCTQCGSREQSSGAPHRTSPQRRIRPFSHSSSRKPTDPVRLLATQDNRNIPQTTILNIRTIPSSPSYNSDMTWKPILSFGQKYK